MKLPLLEESAIKMKKEAKHDLEQGTFGAAQLETRQLGCLDAKKGYFCCARNAYPTLTFLGRGPTCANL